MTLSVAHIAAVVTALRGLLIPAQFEDLKFSVSDESFRELAAAVCDYYNRQDLGIGTLSFDVSCVYSSSFSYAHFGKNGTGGQDVLFHNLVVSACQELDAHVDFSLYDYLVFIVPGMSESDSGDELLFWPRKSSLSEANVRLVLDGVKIDDYALVCELGPDGMFTGHGDFCHEMGHLLGLPDFYDTDGERSGGLSDGLGGPFSLMDKGNRNDGGHNPPGLCAVERDVLNPRLALPLNKGSHSLGIMENTGRFMRLESSVKGRCFFLENREGLGLCISEADRSDRPAGYSDFQTRILTAAERWTVNEVNCRPDNQCARLLSTSARDDDCVGIDSLAVIGVHCLADGAVSFNVVEPLILDALVALQNSVVVEWHSELPDADIESVSAVISGNGGRICAGDVRISDDGRFRLVVDDLDPHSGYLLEICLVYNHVPFTLKRVFQTRNVTAGMPPFILLPSSVRNSDGSFKRGAEFPLLLYNTGGVNEVSWYFDGSVLDGSRYFKVERSGVLEAVLDLSDGTSTVIRKIMDVK